jgi:hypothetical protein
MRIQPYKGRAVDINKKVHVYRCLNRKGHVFSIRQNGYVVGHTTEVHLKNVGFIVNSSGKKRAIETQQRNVHAYIEGLISDEVCYGQSQITYNPYNELGFHLKGTESEITKSQKVCINNKGVFI